MKRTLPIVSLALLSLGSCNMHARKDISLVQIGENPVLQSEYEFALSTVPVERRNDSAVQQRVFLNIVESRVLSVAAQHEVPQALNYVRSLSEKLSTRDLAQLYVTLYLSAQLGHTEEQLLDYYTKNPQLFTPNNANFASSREIVARKLTLAEKGPEALAKFFAEQGLRFADSTGHIPPLDSVRKPVEDAFIAQITQQLTANSVSELRNKYQLQRKPLPIPDAQVFYQQHQKDYLTQASWKLLWVAGSDSSTVANAAFSNEPLVAKKDHCLPNGLGMIPELFAKLESIHQQGITPVIYAPDSKQYVRFQVMQINAPKIKTLDRVQRKINRQLATGSSTSLDSNFVIVTIKGKPAIREADVMRLSLEVPPRQRDEFPRDRLLDFLEQWKLQEMAAKEIGLDTSKAFLALRNLRRHEQWAQVYRDTILNKTLGYPKTELLRLLQENPLLYQGADTSSKVLEAALWKDIPDAVYQIEFGTHPERFTARKSWQEAKTEIFRRIKDGSLRAAQTRLKYRLYYKYGLSVLDSTKKYWFPYQLPALMEQGKKFYENRRLVDSRTLYQIVGDVYSTDSLAFRARTMVANILNEEENFSQARNEYQAVSILWPNHPDSYKAMFMQGFIEAENLKQDSLALQTFKSFINKYPKSDLTDDAEWMIKNIEAGGQLMPAVLDSQPLPSTPEK